MKKNDSLLVFKDIIDYLSPLQTPTEQSIYNYLIRWSFFETGTKEICIGIRTIAKEVSKPAKGRLSKTTGLSYSTVVDCINQLVKKGHIEIKEITRKGKIYSIKLPSDIKEIIELKHKKTQTRRKKTHEDFFASPRLRFEIFKRDNFTCEYCGKKVNEKNATLDHKLPRSKGGDNSKENLVVCCFECNSIKGGKTFEEAAPRLLKRIKTRSKRVK